MSNDPTSQVTAATSRRTFLSRSAVTLWSVLSAGQALEAPTSVGSLSPISWVRFTGSARHFAPGWQFLTSLVRGSF
jgi:hypothetical protein